MRSLTLNQISAILKQPHSLSPALVKGYCVDTRYLKPGEIFFALKGERVDGHDFLAEAQQKGALAAIVAKDYSSTFSDFPLIYVSDPLRALQDLARHVLAHSSSRVVAITGSLGKTTTKDFVHTLLAGSYRIKASPGNSNSQIGLPLSLLNHTSGQEDILVLEMGMTEPGQILTLTQIAPPEVAVLTAVSLVHACNFNSLEDIAWAKAEVFQHAHTRLGILPVDIPSYQAIVNASPCRKLSFSVTGQQADYSFDPADPAKLLANLEHQSIEIKNFTLPGRHNRHNLLAAVIVARHFNVSWDEIKERLNLLQLPERRLQFETRKGIVFINDSYNAAELSVKAALETLPQPTGNGRKIAILGSMLELGKFSEDSHRRVGEFALNFVDECYCFGHECQPIYDAWYQAKRPVQLFEDFNELIHCLKENLQAADVVLIKGSRAKQMWKILEEF